MMGARHGRTFGKSLHYIKGSKDGGAFGQALREPQGTAQVGQAAALPSLHQPDIPVAAIGGLKITVGPRPVETQYMLRLYAPKYDIHGLLFHPLVKPPCPIGLRAQVLNAIMHPRARISGVSVTLDGPQHVCVEVPATTANFGPGFDCLGMALQLHDRLHFYQGTGIGPIITSQGPVRSYCELAHTAASSLFQHLGTSIPALEVQVENHIPIARGLGSSAAAIVGGLVAANHLLSKAVDLETLLNLAVKIEGHPDNVTPALLGGFRVMVQSEGRLHHLKVSVPDSLKAVLFIPDFLMPTEESRKLLPKELSREDAVYNISRAALLVASLANEEMSYLDVATKDKLHQPARSRFFPAMDVIFKAALDAGAKGAFLSGGGPTILALAVEDEESVGRAMLAAAETEGISGEIKITRPSQDGARVVE